MYEILSYIGTVLIFEVVIFIQVSENKALNCE